jgi:hypothetical protein
VIFVYRFDNWSENLPETTATPVGESAPLLLGTPDSRRALSVAQAGLHADPMSSDVGVVFVPDENVMVETVP